MGLLDTLVQQAENASGGAVKNVSHALDFLLKPVPKIAQNVGNAINQGVNDVGQIASKQPLLPGMPNSPTVGQAGGNDFVAGFNNPAGNPTSLAMVLGMMSGTPNPFNPESDIGAVKSSLGDLEAGAQDAKIAKGAKNDLSGLPKGPGKTVARIVLKPSVYGAGKESAVQDTINSHVPGNTATEQYANLEPTMNAFGNKIQATMNSKPKAAAFDTLMSDYDKNLEDQGIYRTSSTTKAAVKNEAQDYSSQLFNLAKDENTGKVLPTDISDQSLYSARLKISQDAKSVYRKIENGTSLTDKDRVILAAGQSVDDTLSNLHPTISGLITKQSHLYQASEPLFDARSAEFKAQDKAAIDAAKPKDIMGSILGPYASNLPLAPLIRAGGNKVLNSPTGRKVTLGGLSLLAAGGGGYELNNLLHPNPNGTDNKGGGGDNNNGNNIGGDNINHGQSIPQERYFVNNDPIKSGQLMKTDDYNNQDNAYTQQIANAKASGDFVGLTKLQGQQAQLENSYKNQTTLRNLWQDPIKGTGNVLTVGNEAYKSIQKADPNFFNALNGGYDKLMNASNGKYSKLGGYLAYIGQATGIDFTKYKTKDALVGALDAAINVSKTQWETQQSLYQSPLSKVLPTGSMRQSPAQAAPAQQPSYPSGGFGGTGNLNLSNIPGMSQ